MNWRDITIPDKALHYGGCLGIWFIIYDFNPHIFWATVIMAILAIGWEVKDHFIADGFSGVDLIADFLGIMAAVFIHSRRWQLMLIAGILSLGVYLLYEWKMGNFPYKLRR